MSVTIAVVAAGAMGAGLGARLAARGARVLTSIEGRSAATARRAEAAGMVPAPDEALAAADLILSVVPPDQAVPLAERLAASIGRVESAPIYADLNAINPATARAVEQALSGTGARFVDGSIIGLPPKADGTGPTVYLSGDAADAQATLSTFGLAAKTLAGGVGAASALKMTYAGLTKGFTALGAAMILAAQREGAAEALAAELGQSQKEMLARLTRSVPDMLPKAYRWVPEMQEIAGFIGPDAPGGAIYRAIGELYRAIAADHAQQGALEQDLLGFFESPHPTLSRRERA